MALKWLSYWGGWHKYGYNEEMRLGVYDLIAETMTEITPVYDTESFDISPDGEKVVYETHSGLYTEIFTINIDGSEKIKLTENSPGDNTQPVFSPDGSNIAFVASEYGYYDTEKIAVMNNDGSDLIYLTDNENRRDENPSFSPDGEKILFNNTW